MGILQKVLSKLSSEKRTKQTDYISPQNEIEIPKEISILEEIEDYILVLSYIARLDSIFTRKSKNFIVDFVSLLNPDINKEYLINTIGHYNPKPIHFRKAVKNLKETGNIETLIETAKKLAGDNKIKQAAVETLIEELNAPVKKEHPPVTENTFEFLPIKMLYQKKSAKEPVEYSIKLKEIYKKDDLYYIKARKDGEKNIKAFRVDRIKRIFIDDMEIQDPLKFLLKGEISSS